MYIHGTALISVKQTSWIDYICISSTLEKHSHDFEVREDGSNLSDHWPVVLTTDVDVGV